MINQIACESDCFSNKRQSTKSILSNRIKKILTSFKIEGAEEMSKTK